MSKGKSDKITYKPYEQNQAYLIPPSADELIPEDHLVRLVSEVIDEMGIERLLRKYQVGGGAIRYHPVMMTKLFVYGYMTKVCSSRMIAKAVGENVMFMRLPLSVSLASSPLVSALSLSVSIGRIKSVWG